MWRKSVSDGNCPQKGVALWTKGISREEFSTKEGGFVEKKRFGWELSTKRAGFVDKRRFREEFSTKRGVFVDSIRTTQSSLKLYYQEVLYPTDLSYWDLHKCVRSDGYPLFSREFAPVLPICIL